jgi:Copper type II ascorbate-dependent monooxygenase, C-terminal domain
MGGEIHAIRWVRGAERIRARAAQERAMNKLGVTVSLAFAALAAAGCNGGVDTDPLSTSTSGVGTGSTGSGSTSASSGTGGGGETVTLTMEKFSVPAGGEVYKCQNFANPFKGVDAEVTTFESHMTLGSHHLLLFYKTGVGDSQIQDCSGLEFAATPYSTQLPDDSVTFPDGVAALVPKDTGLRLQSHYLNTTGQAIDAHVEITFHLAQPGTVKDHAGVLFVVEPKIKVDPMSTGTVSHNCALPLDMNIIKAASHMHKHGTNFVASISGETVFQTTQWDDPKPTYFMPPKAVKAGEPLSFTCTYKNDSPSTLTFGESAQTNEMCIFVSAFYPVADDTQVTVPCQ